MSRILRNRNIVSLACLIALVGLLLLAPGPDVALAKKPPKPTPTPTPVPESPDLEIVYSHSKKTGGNWKNSIRVMNADGTNQRVIVDCGTAYCGSPNWSHNGSQIVFVSDAFDLSDPPFTPSIYTVDLDDSNISELVPLNGGPGQPDWSPVTIGGQHWIVYADYDENDIAQLFTVNEAGDHIVQLTPTTDYGAFDFVEPTWSADGRFISYISVEAGIPHIQFAELDRTAAVPTRAATGDPGWPGMFGLYYDLPPFDHMHTPHWSPIYGDYRLLSTGEGNTFLFEFGPYPFELENASGGDFPNFVPDTATDLGAMQETRWSPDASELVYVNDNKIYRANADGSGAPTVLVRGNANTIVASPAWCPPLIMFWQKLTASDAATGDHFGTLFSDGNVSGDTAIIGAYMDDHDGLVDAGSAYVFTLSGGTWTEQEKLTASDAAAGDHFGRFVVISGDVAIITSYQDDHSDFEDAGSAYVFTNVGGTWTEQQKLTAPVPADFHRFGWNAAISGDTLVIGACNWDAAYLHEGSAYVFTRNGETWSLQQVLTASDGAISNLFGYFTVISGDLLVVGAPWDDHGQSGLVSAGAAYVFTRTENTWTEQQKLIASDDPAEWDNFGRCVSISNDTMMIGAQWDDSPRPDDGSVYVFNRIGGIWTEQQKLTASDPGYWDNFGSSVVVSGDTAVVSSIADDVSGYNDGGSIYLFTRVGGTWTERRKVTASDKDYYDHFGWGLPMSGGTLLTGAPDDDHSSLEDAGSVYGYRLIPAPEGF